MTDFASLRGFKSRVGARATQRNEIARLLNALSSSLVSERYSPVCVEYIFSLKINYFTSHMAYISVYLLGVTSSAEALIVCLGVIQLPGGRQNGVKVFTGLGVCEINKRDGERDSESHPRGGLTRYFETLEILSASTSRDSHCGRVCHTQPSLFHSLLERVLLSYLRGHSELRLHVC